ncbi:DNA polymerase III subunit beta [candidate division WWE3 bacterium CG08_land_8_20_14_0_20_40_13]|uniref:Beta sliding clamp n=1 Tax=candidate division WWE3 bacterium CG08_land_8_20_14_0_20_40_13 TaxID=1975084 RepID=A0A2H0XE60_UNCKA|nr:MAG: DNA polymerase III subunit beta [candidate division WWE3 bacterium CG08_land_8_20_14_0_20_40_13]
MKFEVLLDNFVKGLSYAGKAISVKATLPVLANVLLETDKGRIKISATDLEKSVSVWVGAKVLEEGSITIPARVLYEFVASIKAPQITARVEGGFLVLESEGVYSKISGMAPEEFPKLLAEEKGNEICGIDPKVLADAVSKVSFAAASDDSRPILTGIMINFSKDSLTFAAVDGFRLAEKVITLKKSAVKEFSCVVPAKSLAEIARIFGGGEKEVEVGFFENDNAFYISSPDIFATIRVLEGDFPDYKKIIPQDSTSKAEFATSDFSQSIRLAGVFAKDESKIIKLTLIKEKEEIEVRSETQEVGEVLAKIKAKCEGDDITIAFNSKFLADFLANLPNPQGVLEMVSMGPLSPALFVVEKNQNYRYVVMPVRVSG